MRMDVYNTTLHVGYDSNSPWRSLILDAAGAY